MIKERLATIAVLLVLTIVPCSVFCYQYIYLPARRPPDARVFDITAVGAGSGAFTLEDVNGLNYWWKRFSPMTILLEVGDPVILRLRSADVTHQFYIPRLNVGPVDIKPGHVKEVRFTAEKAGIYQYFCTTMCGNCHCYMTGWIVVNPEGRSHNTPDPIVCPVCFVDYDKPADGDMIRLGDYLYLKNSCNPCHGWEGVGGVRNPNYAKESVPAHNTTAQKIFLKAKEDADAFSELLRSQEDLDDLEEDPDIPMFKVVLARYRALKELIRNGSPPQKLDPSGPEPPLWMPAWQYKLSDREIDALILYFIDLYPWEEDEEEMLS
jgi:hypothetical protein